MNAVNPPLVQPLVAQVAQVAQPLQQPSSKF